MEVKGDDESASVGSSQPSSSEDDDISFVNDWISCQDTAWEDLPEEVKTAARVFGWNAEIWDDDGHPADADCYWNKSTEEQKAANYNLHIHRDTS